MSHDLHRRLRHLEAHGRGRPAHGYRIMRQAPNGEITGDVVMVPGARPGVASRICTPVEFTAQYPDGVILTYLILEDDGRPAQPGSLLAEWFGPGHGST